jgi:hypothetical protein
MTPDADLYGGIAIRIGCLISRKEAIRAGEAAAATASILFFSVKTAFSQYLYTNVTHQVAFVLLLTGG